MFTSTVLVYWKSLAFCSHIHHTEMPYFEGQTQRMLCRSGAPQGQSGYTGNAGKWNQSKIGRITNTVVGYKIAYIM